MENSTLERIASSVGRMLARARQNKVNQAVDSWNSRRELLRRIAINQDIDEGDYIDILRETGESESELLRQAKVMAERLRWHKDVQGMPAAENQAKQLRAEMERVSSELNDYVAKANQKLTELNRQALAAESLVNGGTVAITQLRATVLDPSILLERDVIAAERKSISDEERELRDELSMSVPHSTAVAIYEADQKIKAIKSKQDSDSLDKWTERLRIFEQRKQAAEMRLRELDRQRIALDTRAEANERRALEP